MEDELGKQLFIRGNRKITLTEEGMILRKRSEEIIGLVKKTEDEIALSDDISEGDIYIGAGETHAIHILTDSAIQLQTSYPNIRFILLVVIQLMFWKNWTEDSLTLACYWVLLIKQNMSI